MPTTVDIAMRSKPGRQVCRGEMRTSARTTWSWRRFVVMRRLGLGMAFALDQHFEEQGFAVKPAAAREDD